MIVGTSYVSDQVQEALTPEHGASLAWLLNAGQCNATKCTSFGLRRQFYLFWRTPSSSVVVTACSRCGVNTDACEILINYNLKETWLYYISTQPNVIWHAHFNHILFILHSNQEITLHKMLRRQTGLLLLIHKQTQHILAGITSYEASHYAVFFSVLLFHSFYAQTFSSAPQSMFFP
jgi:hypothetical protein